MLTWNAQLERWESGSILLPNVKTFFVPDRGKILFDIDLAGADAQVVAWEAGDEPLKQAFRDYAAGRGPKVHCVNAISIFGDRAGPTGKAMPYYHYAKMGVHLTNYGGEAKTCAASLKISQWEAQNFQNKWFAEHPAIKDWHERTAYTLQTTRTIKNQFGYTRTYYDRYSKNILQQALAWTPQSTVALVINKILLRIVRTIPEIEILLQVHDSLVGQCDIPLWADVKPRLHEASRIVIPYADPLIIPVGLKTSKLSWGHCKDEEWAA